MTDIIITGHARPAPTIARVLDDRGYDLVHVDGGGAAVRHLRDEGAAAVVVCLPLESAPDDVIRAIHAIDPHIPIIVTGRDGAIEGAYDAFENGAWEYLDGPIEPQEILTVVGVATGSRKGDVHLRYLREQGVAEVAREKLVASCRPMMKVLRVVRQLCIRTSVDKAPTILITGETGTGKGLLARFIHYRGGRRSKPFVELNCAALPSQLLESELFGHERGAFTDAKAQRIGLFETAHRGTLFLDEIGSAPLKVQAKLLKAIEEKRIRRVGGSESIEVDVQVIAATHENLVRRVREERFRGDLYHRLNVVAIKLPALRDRGEDRVRLAEQFLEALCRNYGLPPRSLAPAARDYIEAYTWPGNIRELRNDIERIVLLHDDAIVDARHFESGLSNAPPSSVPPASSRRPPASERPRSPASRRTESGFMLCIPEEGVSLAAIEESAIRQSLERFDGNVSQAARHLQITRQTLIYRMRKHGLTVKRRVD